MKHAFDVAAGDPVALPERGLFHRRHHLFEQKEIDAIRAALDARRPLLLRGEPGTGKTQVAEAAAEVLRRPLVEFVVDGRTEPRDLLYSVDFVMRLAHAQMLGAIPPQEREDKRRLEDQLTLSDFTRPGPLWWAYDWKGADGMKLKEERRPPEGWEPSAGCVVLIDEIDKAGADVPNGLLGALGSGRFTGPDGQIVGRQDDDGDGVSTPLVIITTNRERDLPDAFLRRCLVHEIVLPDDRDAFVEHLRVRGAAHFGDCDESVLLRAAMDLHEDRAAVGDGARPGIAEYLDLLRVVTTGTDSVDEQLKRLAAVRGFIFQKFGETVAADPDPARDHETPAR